MSAPPLPSTPPVGPYLAALTHPSWANENDGGEDYQRLEFLGDALIKGYVAELLYRTFPGEDEGKLSDRLHQLVSRVGLARAARGLGLDDPEGLGRFVRLGRSERQANHAGLSEKILEEMFEAWVGATFLVAGPEAARALVHEAAQRVGLNPIAWTNHKDALQRIVQRHANALPSYRVERDPGSLDHEPRWVAVGLVPAAAGAPWGGAIEATADGRSKLLAEQAVARALLLALGLDPDAAPTEAPLAPVAAAAGPPPAPKMARSALKEHADQTAGAPPTYAAEERGSPQRRVFAATCSYRGLVGAGEASSKRGALEAAAAEVLAQLSARAPGA